jgi:hypothetical protein
MAVGLCAGQTFDHQWIFWEPWQALHRGQRAIEILEQAVR